MTGLQERDGEDLTKEVTLILSEKFKMNNVGMSCQRIGNSQNQKRPILIKFNNIWDKRKMYKERIQVLKNTTIFINEDLTKEVAELAFKARELRRNNKIVQTWTEDGKVMVKENKDDKPRQILKNDQLFDQQNDSSLKQSTEQQRLYMPSVTESDNSIDISQNKSPNSQAQEGASTNPHPCLASVHLTAGLNPGLMKNASK